MNKVQPKSLSSPALELLEDRLLLDAAPVFQTALEDAYTFAGPAVTLGIDAFDADGDAVTISAISDQAGLNTVVPTGNQFARLSFVESDGVTPLGEVVVELFEQRSADATERFITLAQNEVAADGTLDPAGTPYYSDVPVHRVNADVLIRTGDGTNGDGTGDSPLPFFDDSFHPQLRFAGPGVLAMDNDGEDTNDSRFFITLQALPDFNGQSMIFGQVISGLDVVETISNRPADSNNRPDDPPLLDSVDVFNSDQLGSLILLADGFAGQANVTVTLDDGNGNTTEKTIAVTALGDRPQITNPGTQTLDAGGSLTIPVTITDDGGETLEVTAFSSYSGASVSYDAGASTVTITMADDVPAAFQVTLTAVESGQAGLGLSPSSMTFTAVAEDSEGPALLGYQDSAGTALATAVAGDRLYVAAGQSGVEVYDISDPSSPVLLGSYDTAGAALDVVVDGTRVYVADEYGGMVSLDVSDPSAISEIDRVSAEEIGSGAAVMDLELDNGRLYAAQYVMGLGIYDVTDGEFTRLGQAQLTQQASRFYLVDLAIDGQLLYASDWTGDVWILLVRNPRRIVALNAINVAHPRDLVYEDNTLYVADNSQGVLTFDVTNFRRPEQKGSAYDLGGPAWSIAARNHMLVVGVGSGDQPGRFVVLDAADPTDLEPVTSIQAALSSSIGASSMGVTIFGSDLALTAGSDGVMLLDADNLLSATRRRIPSRGAHVFTDSSGDRIAVALRGPGTGLLEYSAGANSDIQDIELHNTTDRSVLVIGGRGTTQVGSIDIEGSLLVLSAGRTNLTGDLRVTGGGLTKLILGNLSGPAQQQVDLGTSARPVVALLGEVSDATLQTNSTLHVLRVRDWQDDLGPADTIQAPTTTVVLSLGDMQADLSTGSLVKGVIVGSMVEADWNIVDGARVVVVRGNMTDSYLRTAGPSGLIKLVVSGWMRRSSVLSASDIGGVVTSGMVESNLYAGVPDTSVVPQPAGSDLDLLEATLQRLVVTGRLTTPSGHAMVDSHLAAAELGVLSVRYADNDQPDTRCSLGGDQLRLLVGLTDEGNRVIMTAEEFQQALTRVDAGDDPEAPGDFDILRVI